MPGAMGSAPFNRIRGGYDTSDPAAIAGRQLTTFSSTPGSVVFEDSGPLELSAD